MERPTAQYDDCVGEVALDFHMPQISLQDLAKAAGVDTDKYFAIGFKAYDLDLHVWRIYAVEQAEFPRTHPSDELAYLRANPSKIIEFDCVDKKGSEREFDYPQICWALMNGPPQHPAGPNRSLFSLEPMTTGLS